MKKIRVADLPEKERRSPSGKFHTYYKEVSVALGRDPESTDRLKQHPFDLSVYRVPPGASRCPYHVHSEESELYLVISGRAAVRHEQGITEIEAGEACFFGPGEAHEIRNPGAADLVYYVIADNAVAECCYYPDSDKWWVNDGKASKIMKGRVVDYFAGEDEGGGWR
jgi:uncharacterized cupin superfamily protein